MKEFNKAEKIKEKKRKTLNERMKPWKNEARVRDAFQCLRNGWNYIR